VILFVTSLFAVYEAVIQVKSM